MDAVKYFEEKRRMLNSLGRKRLHCEGVICLKCPLSSQNNKKGKDCKTLEIECPETAIEIVEKWSAENPLKTMLQDFLEKYPNAPIDEDDKTPTVCPYSLGYEEEDAHGCFSDCMSCWNRPLEG